MGLAARLAEAPVAVAQGCTPMLQPACDCGAPAAFSGRCEACDRLSLGPGPASAHPPLPLRPARPPKPERGQARAAAPIFLPAPAIRSTAPVAPQTRLHLSSPGDAAEREAHAVGRQVARMPEPGQPMPVQQHDTGGRTVFRRAAGTAEMHEDALARIEAGGSSGEELPTRLRLFMEPRFGTDFGAVRIHKDGHAAASSGQLGAQAFTVGRDIYFGKDQFQPDSPAGRELIAHELTHTIQQGHVAQKPAGPVAKPVPAGKAASAAGAPAAQPAHAAPLPGLDAAHPKAAGIRAATSGAHAAAKPAAGPDAARAAKTDMAKTAPPASPRAAPAAAPPPAARVGQRAPMAVQRLGISDAWAYFADKANVIPGFRMLSIVLGVNPLTMAPVDRSAANILRAVIEFLPGGGFITQALHNSGIFEKVGGWIGEQLATLKMTGSALKDAVTTFLGTLKFSDIFDLGGVWERAKRIFTEPIDQLISFAKTLVVGILKFVKDAILLPLAKLAEGTKGWDLLIAVLGKNPITGEPVPQTADTLIGGFMKLIGQDEIWDNMKKSNAVPRAWTWFKGAMAAVLAFVSQIPDLFIAAFTSLTIEDVVLVAGAFRKVASVFGGFLGKFFDWAGTAIWNLLEIIFDVVSPGALTYVKKTGAALKGILKNPLPFVGNLVKAAKLGFQNFAAHFGDHLKSGLIDWLTRALPGVYLPKAVSLAEIGKFALSVLGITWAQIRGRIVKALGPNGEKIMTTLETTFDVVVALAKGGPAAAWELIKEKLSDLKDTVISALTSFVMDTIVSKAVPKLLSLFVPGAGFISAILSIYDTVMVFVNKLAKIVAAVKAFVDSIVAIAAGQIEGAAAKVESTLSGLLSLAINFLAGFVGLGNIADKVMGVIKKVQAAVDKALDAAIAWVIGKAKALFAKSFGKGDKPDDRTDAQKQADLDKGVAEAEALLIDSKLSRQDAAKKLPGIQARYRMTKLEIVTDAADATKETDHIHGEINPVKDTQAHQKPVVVVPRSIINYDPVNPLGGAAKATASILSTDHDPGSSPSAEPPIWANLANLGAGLNKPVRANWYVRGHLLNENLGGPGEQQNLTPITKIANNKHKQFAETEIKDWVINQHIVMSYTITVGPAWGSSVNIPRLTDLRKKAVLTPKEQNEVQSLEALRALPKGLDVDAKELEQVTPGQWTPKSGGKIKQLGIINDVTSGSQTYGYQ